MLINTLRVLLQRLYNWIKYKSLPPSFLFRNRLFIERDTKHKRIYSMFGLVFRNSKWSNFELANIKQEFKTNYFRLTLWIFFFIFLVLVCTIHQKYYARSYWFSSVFFFFWSGIDIFDYYLSFYLWCLTALLNISLNWIYSYFLVQPWLKKNNLHSAKRHPFFIQFTLKDETKKKTLSLSKEELQYLFYSWITTHPTNYSASLVENLFDGASNKKLWDTHYDFFIKIFKVSHFCNLSSKNYALQHLQYTWTFARPFYPDSAFKRFFTSNQSRACYLRFHALISWFHVKNYSNYFEFAVNEHPSLLFLKQRQLWNLYEFDLEFSKKTFNLKHYADLFYTPLLSFNKLSTIMINSCELWNFSTFVKSQNAGMKWNRWLYRYSLLHRRFLRNSHKITLGKRLVSSGFYNTDLFDKNAWASRYAKKFDRPLLQNLSHILYSNIFKSNFVSTWTRFDGTLKSRKATLVNLQLLTNYEESFLWLTKRFFLFNTISANDIKTSVSFLQEGLLNRVMPKDNKFNNLALSAYLTQLYLFSSADFNLYEKFSIDATYLFNKTKTDTQPNYYLKDVNLLFCESDLLDFEILEIIAFVTGSANTSQASSLVSNYVNITYNNVNDFFLFYGEHQPKIYVPTNINQTLMLDLIALSFF